MIIHHLLCLTVALIIDHFIGDPPSWPHPVRMIGSLISRFDRKLNHGKHKKEKGVFMLILAVLVPVTATLLLLLAAYHIHLIFGMAVEAIIIAATIAQSGLAVAAEQVYEPLANGNLDQARIETAMIVGRDTDQLDEGELTRAAVETVAENVSDGITVPLFWAAVGGAPLAILYRAVNTCDSMVGYQNKKYEEFGWASARFDDVLNWIPARITGFLMLLGGGATQNKWQLFRMLPREAIKHPSPNSGWGEAAAALILGVQLGGTNFYNGVVSERAKMGQNLKPLDRQHILEIIAIMKRTVFLFLLLLWIGGVLLAITAAWF